MPLEAAGGLDGLDECLRGQVGDLLRFVTAPREERRHGADVGLSAAKPSPHYIDRATAVTVAVRKKSCRLTRPRWLV
jgi:hypothetical protein